MSREASGVVVDTFSVEYTHTQTFEYTQENTYPYLTAHFPVTLWMYLVAVGYQGETGSQTNVVGSSKGYLNQQ